MDEEMAVSAEERNFATLTHLGGIFFSFVPALIVWLLKKDASTFLADQSKEALNFQITVLIGVFASYILMLLLVGFLLLPAVLLANLVLCIVAAVTASSGKNYRYPFALRLIQ